MGMKQTNPFENHSTHTIPRFLNQIMKFDDQRQ